MAGTWTGAEKTASERVTSPTTSPWRLYCFTLAAVAACCRPGKINYAILGNEVPHLHCHVVPRYPTDGWWGQAFSLRPAAQRKPLSPAEYARLQRALRAALTGA